MNRLALSEVSAGQLGLPLWFWRIVLVAATGWMVGVSVALAGAFGFFGLGNPHLSRLCGFTDHPVLPPGPHLARARPLLARTLFRRPRVVGPPGPMGRGVPHVGRAGR
ncbi:iron chelate uptake ABC transporter family permease subunit, partial [Escherichia coli]